MNSLFEDNAEFGLGMALGQKAIRNRLVGYVTEIKDTTDNADLKAACEGYLDTITDSTSSRPATDALIAELEKAVDDAKVGELAKKTLVDKDELAKKSMWIFGGDGWAYDIGTFSYSTQRFTPTQAASPPRLLLSAPLHSSQLPVRL